jgi:hypothetical protein
MKVHPIDMNVSIHITQGGNGSQGDLEWLVPWKWGNREGIPDKIRHVVGLPYYVEIEEARDGSLDRLWYRSKGNRRYRQVIAEARWEHLILLETTIRRLVFRVVLPGWVSEEEILGKVMAKARKHTRAVVKRVPALGRLDDSGRGDGYDREVGLLFRGGRLITARAVIFDRESCEAWAGVSIDGILAD